MEAAAELAGFFSAHAVWCVSDGETLIPIYGMHHKTKGRSMERLALERLEDAAQAGQVRLSSNPHRAERATLICDGRIPLGKRKVDALIVEFREFSSPADAIVVAIPYTPPSKTRAFAIHRPKVLQFPKHLEADGPKIMEAFFRGVASHEEGVAVWNQHLDESM